MYETQQWLGSNLTQHTARDYEIFQEWRDDGMSDYVCIPVELTNGALNIISFASKHKIGFSF
jgi:hypothetical protein